MAYSIELRYDHAQGKVAFLCSCGEGLDNGWMPVATSVEAARIRGRAHLSTHRG